MVSGLKLQFIGASILKRSCFQPRLTEEEKKILGTEIQEMIKTGAITHVSAQGTQFMGHMFLCPKKDGSHRPIFDFKPLNQHIKYQHLKMEGLPMVKTLLQMNDWMIKLDLKDAYFGIPIAKNHRRFLRFKRMKQKHQFQCLSFGLGQPPETLPN